MITSIADYLRGIGITPYSALFIALSVWATSQYFKFKIEMEKEKYKLKLEFLADKLKKRSAALEELNELVHDFDHCVQHVCEGDRGCYEATIEEKRKYIRKISRKRAEIIKVDFPEFLKLMYRFTNEGALILKSGFDYNRYENTKKDLFLLFEKIRATLPSM